MTIQEHIAAMRQGQKSAVALFDIGGDIHHRFMTASRAAHNSLRAEFPGEYAHRYEHRLTPFGGYHSGYHGITSSDDYETFTICESSSHDDGTSYEYETFPISILLASDDLRGPMIDAIVKGRYDIKRVQLSNAPALRAAAVADKERAEYDRLRAKYGTIGA